MDTELILAIVGVVFAVVALGALLLVQQARIKRENQEKVKATEHSTGTALKPFFVARYRGSKARFFRVYPDEDAFLFINAGPYTVVLDAETARGTDRRHGIVQSAKLLATGLAIGAVVAGAIIFTIGRDPVQNNKPDAGSSVTYGVIGLIVLLAAGFAVALPAAVWRVVRRVAELDAMPPDRLRAEAETELSFRAGHDGFFDIKFALLELHGAQIGATLTFRHKPTGKWTIETTTTGDTRAALAEFLDAFGEEIVVIEEALEKRLAGRTPEKPKAVREKGRKREREEKIETTGAPRRTFGFPLLMLAGFAAGAAVAVVLAFVIAGEKKTFRYTTLLELVAAIGGAGTYLGHVIGATRNKDAGIEPFGPLTPGVMMTGAAIWFGGVVAVCAAVLGVMTAIHGPPPH